jgi:tetratricopeptide (TPR) repeat protein
MSVGVIVLAALNVYANSFNGVPIHDDGDAICTNPTIRRLWPIWPTLCPPNVPAVGGRPVVNFTLALNHVLGGYNQYEVGITKIRGYHAVNVGLHVAVALLLFALCRRTFQLPRVRTPIGDAATALALVISVLWVVHPLGTEPVDYTIQRAEQLAALFYLLVLYCILRGSSSPRRWAWYCGAVVASAAGMASKEIVVTVPLAALLYDRTFLTGSFRKALRCRWGVYTALAATWGILIYLVPLQGDLARSFEDAANYPPQWNYLRGQPNVILHYLRLTLIPFPQLGAGNHTLPSGIWADELPGILVVGALGLATLWAVWRQPAWGFLAAFFFLYLSPTSSFLPLWDSMCEHRMYLPLASVLALLVLAGYFAGRSLVRRGRLLARSAAILGLSVAFTAAVAWGLLTIQRNRLYRSIIDVWLEIADRSPQYPRGHSVAACYLEQGGRVNEAIDHLRQALDAERHYPMPSYRPQDTSLFPEVHNNLGMALARQNQIEEAANQFRKALEYAPGFSIAANSLVHILVTQGKDQEALECLLEVVTVRPNSATAQFDLACLLLQMGRIDDAIERLKKAVELRPDYVQARHHLEVLLHQQAAANPNAPPAAANNANSPQHPSRAPASP